MLPQVGDWNSFLGYFHFSSGLIYVGLCVYVYTLILSIVIYLGLQDLNLKMSDYPTEVVTKLEGEMFGIPGSMIT